LCRVGISLLEPLPALIKGHALGRLRQVGRNRREQQGSHEASKLRNTALQRAVTWAIEQPLLLLLLPLLCARALQLGQAHPCLLLARHQTGYAAVLLPGCRR
jgi:hypothetical protein